MDDPIRETHITIEGLDVTLRDRSGVNNTFTISIGNTSDRMLEDRVIGLIQNTLTASVHDVQDDDSILHPRTIDIRSEHCSFCAFEHLGTRTFESVQEKLVKLSRPHTRLVKQNDSDHNADSIATNIVTYLRTKGHPLGEDDRRELASLLEKELQKGCHSFQRS